LGRTRPPIPCELPFTYWVFGRPVSVQNDGGSRPRALSDWRRKVGAALGVAVALATKDRGFELISHKVEARIIWLSTDPENPDHPDVDNMVKPLIDALNREVIDDDRQVHRILAEKGDINDPPSTLLQIWPEILDDEEYVLTGEVTVVRISYFVLEFQT
jgi:Holliday junction resolvase RusA-like endonuclease